MLQGSVQSRTPGRRGQRQPNDNQFCVKKFIKCSESYDAESMGNGVQRPTRDIEVSEGGRQACTPCRHMEGVDKGHLGIECHRRSSNTSERGSPTTSKALRKCILRRAGSSSERKGRNPFAERGHIPVPAEHRGFLLHNILVPKENGQMRPVINLKNLNQWVEAQHFKMEGIATLKDLLRLGDWMVKVDLKDAYFTIPIHHLHQQLLRFTVKGMS